jgi:hypothetical protein
MLEHDAYIREGHADTVRKLLLDRENYKYQIFGSAMECWWVNQQVAKNMVALAKRDFTHIIRGPMWYVEMAGASESVKSKQFEVDPNAKEPHPVYNYRKHFQYWVDTGVIDLLPWDLKALWPISNSADYKVPLQYVGRCPLIYKRKFDLQNKKAFFKDGYEHLPDEYRNIETYSRPVVQGVDVDHGISNMRYSNGKVRHASDYYKGSGAIPVDLNDQPH